MTDKHIWDDFGKFSGIIFSTNSKKDGFLDIRCKKIKKNGEWEKNEESIEIKIDLHELLSIYDVLDYKKKIWETFHTSNKTETKISFGWDEFDTEELLWIKIGDFKRPLRYPSTEILRQYIDHLIDEKVEFFFSQKTGIIFSNDSKDDGIINIKCCKKNKNGEWDKKEECKNDKINFRELISLCDYLNSKKTEYKPGNIFYKSENEISFAWDEFGPNVFWITIDDYKRSLNYSETELLRRLINHLVAEKIRFADRLNLE